MWLYGEVTSPPFSVDARIETGIFLRRIQKGEKLSLPHSRPMPPIGKGCHELRIVDENNTWRIIYHLAEDAVVILEVFSKKTKQTPQHIIELCKKRLKYFYS